MSKVANKTSQDYDADDETTEPKTRRRPLQRGESIPPVPTMVEQIEQAWKAANDSKPKAK